MTVPLGGAVGRQRIDDGLAADLQRLALTWQQLTPGYPAAANVSQWK
ncbi:hypothetical protein IV102_35410 [bacterium]|nr:hypothetical protein [bacterium]